MLKKKIVYPDNWDEDDIIRFKYYVNEGKKMFDLQEDLIYLCCTQQINEEKGLCPPFDYSIVKDIPVNNNED